MERLGFAGLLDRPASAASAWDGFAITLAASGVLVLMVTVFPSLDLLIARQFYTGGGHFLGEAGLISRGLRNVFIAVYFVGCGVCVAALLITRDRVRSFLSISFSKWLFLALCLSIGPGVVANLALKDQLGRARPRDVVEFGGTQNFTAALVPSKECVRNCSFVCGESSSIFALFFAGACLWRRWSMTMILSGLAAGGVAGLVRMSQGAHFLSDVVYSAVFMALSVLALRWLFDAIASSVQAEHDISPPDADGDITSFSRYEAAAE